MPTSFRPARRALAACFALGATFLACSVDSVDLGARPDGGTADDDPGAALPGEGPSGRDAGPGDGSVEAGGGGGGGGDDDAGSDAGPPLGPSAGCGKPAAPGVTNVTLSVGGRERRYLLSVPAGYDPTKPLPLVVGLHGTGDLDGSPAKAREHYGVEAEAAGKAVFVYPAALPEAGGAATDLRWDPDRPSPDFAFVSATLDAVEGAVCIDRTKVFAVGFSNGGRMAATLGCVQGDRFRAVAALGPGGNENTAPLGSCTGDAALWGGRGRDDAQHLPGERLVLAYYPKANGCLETTTATTPNGCRAYDACRAGAEVTWCAWAGGHVWPAYGAAGVWGFFARQR